MKKFLLCIIVICCLLRYYPVNADANAEIDNLSNSNDITLKLLTPQLQIAVNVFYAPYLTVYPTVVWYCAKIIEIKDNEVSIEVFPFIGAHNSVGKDKITFDISNIGEVILKDFTHIESYADKLPTHLQSLIKKPLP